MVVVFSPVQAAVWSACSTAIIWMSIAVTLYDQVFLARFDWHILTGKRKRRPVHLAYFGTKLGWWLYMITILIRNYAPGPLDCQASMIAIQAFMGVTNTCSSILLAFRAVCVYRGQTRTYVTYGLAVGALALAASWFAGTEDIVAAWSDVPGNLWANGRCNMVAVKIPYFVKYLLTILFDLAVLILTVVGVMQMTRSGTSRIGTLLIEQGCLYFLAVFLVNLPILVLSAAQTGPILTLFFAIPSAAISLVISTRMYAKLSDEAGHQPGGISSDQLTSGGSVSEKVINFFARRRGGQRRGSVPSTGQTTTTDSNNTRTGDMGHRIYSDGDGSGGGSVVDVEKQGSLAAPAVLPGAPRRSGGRPFSSLTAAPTSSDQRYQSRRQGHDRSYRGHRHSTSATGSLEGVQVEQTQTTVEESIPEYLVHSGFLTRQELNRIHPAAAADRVRGSRGVVADQFPHLLSANKTMNAKEEERE